LIPWGYWTATLSAYTNTYYQQIAGVNQTFVASGNSKTIDFKLARVLARSQNDVFGGYVRLSVASVRASSKIRKSAAAS
jgi:hemolysin activation/secretion protein